MKVSYLFLRALVLVLVASSRLPVSVDESKKWVQDERDLRILHPFF